jgi:penicillin-binding protein 1A
MLHGSLISLVIALIAGLLGFVAVAFFAAGVVKILLFLSLVFFLLSSIRMRRTVPPLCLRYRTSVAEPHPRTQWGWTIPILTWFRRMRVGSLAAARRIRSSRIGRLRGRRGVLYLVTGATVITAALVAAGFHHVYFDRTNLPDIGPFTRFEFPTIGHVYDVRGHPLIELATEYRQIIKYEGIPPIVRDAILATEDRNFFSHNGVDYSIIPRVLCKVRIGTLVAHLTRLGGHDGVNSPAIFPQGGSTITQQLVRGHFLRDLTVFQNLTAQENSNQLRHGVLFPRALSCMIGSRSVNMLVRKLEEIRLSLWLEKEMQKRFGSKRRAKEEILARYASFIYMGNGQYGFARAAEYYFGRDLAAFTVEDADKAALLAGIAKSPRYYAPSANETERVLRRRNQTLALMAANGFISPDTKKAAEQRRIPVDARNKGKMLQAAAVVESVLEELKNAGADLSVENLLQGRIQVYSTVDARVQQIVNEALELGLERYEKRHPSSKGLIQGSVVALRNLDASVLAETGGRQFYKDRSASYSDFNRVTESLRQPGSAMKPIVYLAAFRQGPFNLETMVPDEPISVFDGGKQSTKSISNYDGQFKGMIPLREALAESRNAVAIWITEQIGIASVLRTSRSLGVQTPLQPYATTALGASEVNLLELANAYRTMASGILAQPHVIRKVVRESGQVAADDEHGGSPVSVDDDALALIQEGLRGVVRIPTGTAHALDSSGFPIAVMGKTGTTNDFRDALFVGSTYGPAGITVAVRIGFDDNHSLGLKETGGRVALPVFKEILLRVYREKLLGPVPEFPAQMEQSINAYLEGDSPDGADLPLLGMSRIRACDPWPGRSSSSQ